MFNFNVILAFFKLFIYLFFLKKEGWTGLVNVPHVCMYTYIQFIPFGTHGNTLHCYWHHFCVFCYICTYLVYYFHTEYWDSPHWLCSWPGSRCCSSWPVIAVDSRNHHSSCCLPLWMVAQLWGWMAAVQQQCSRMSPRWRRCGSWPGQRNTRGPQRLHDGSWTCAPPSQRAGRSWKHK